MPSLFPALSGAKPKTLSDAIRAARKRKHVECSNAEAEGWAEQERGRRR
jgi:hypothetical protein